MYKATKPGFQQQYSVKHADMTISMFYTVLMFLGPILSNVSFHWYAFCLLVVLVKSSLLAK